MTALRISIAQFIPNLLYSGDVEDAQSQHTLKLPATKEVKFALASKNNERIRNRKRLHGGVKLAKKETAIRLNKRKIVAKRKPVKTVKLNLGNQSKCITLNSNYESCAPRYALCSEIDRNKNSITLVSSFTGCRESLATYAQGAINNINVYGTDNKKFSRNKTCVAVLITTGTKSHRREVVCSKKQIGMTYKDWVPKVFKTGLNLINHYEKRKKWMLTKLYKLSYKLPYDKPAVHMIYGFIGSRWWINSPQSFSLFNLLIRLGRYEELWPIRANTSHEGVLKALKRIDRNNKCAGRDYSRVFVDEWEVFFDKFKEIYKGRKSLESNWKLDVFNHDVTRIGIQSLVEGNCNDSTIQNRFTKVLRGGL